MKPYEFIAHTADLGVRVYGHTQEELFINAARALFSLLLEDYRSTPTKQKDIELQADTREDLLVNWLSELISAFFAEKFLPAAYRLSITPAGKKYVLRARLTGEDFDPYRNRITREVKAATYHDLKIKKVPRGFKAEIVFDV